jgi:hypothetical protein
LSRRELPGRIYTERLGLLELAVRRVIRENVCHVVPLPGVVWAAVRRELENPWDTRLAMEDWVERRSGRK